MNTPTSKSRSAVQRALPILIFTILFGIVLALLAWRGVRKAEDFDADSQEFASYARVCEGNALPVASVFNRQSPEHPTIIFRATSEGWQLDRSPIPEELFPARLADVQLVLCVEEPEVVDAPLCPEGTAGEVAKTITGPRLPIRLMAAATGAVIQRAALGLDVPAGDCWPSDEEGQLPTFPSDAEIWSWIAPFVSSNQ